MSDRNERIAQALERLFRTYQQSDRGSPEEIVRERMARAEVHFEAVETHELVDIEAAVKAFISGSVPGHNPSFSPSAPLVGAECRRQMNLRLESSHRDRLANALPPPPDREIPASERQRVGEGFKRLAVDLGSKLEGEREEDDRRRKMDWEKVNERFRPDMSSEAVSRRLGFSVGCDDGE